MRKDYVNGESFVAHQFVDHIETIDRLCNIVYGWCAVCCACGCIFIVLSLYCICFSKVFFFLDFEAADAATDYARMKRWKENSSKCLIIYRFTQHLLHKNSEQHSRLQLKWYLDKRRIHVSQEENSENKTKIQRAKKKFTSLKTNTVHMAGFHSNLYLMFIDDAEFNACLTTSYCCFGFDRHRFYH